MQGHVKIHRSFLCNGQPLTIWEAHKERKNTILTFIGNWLERLVAANPEINIWLSQPLAIAWLSLSYFLVKLPKYLISSIFHTLQITVYVLFLIAVRSREKFLSFSSETFTSRKYVNKYSNTLYYSNTIVINSFFPLAFFLCNCSSLEALSALPS